MKTRFLLVTLVLSFSAGLAAKAGEYKKVDRNGLAFDSRRTEMQYNALHEFFAKKAKGWKYAPPHEAGNFIEEAWCNKCRDPESIGGYETESAGAEWYELSTLTYDLPDVFGLCVHAGKNPQGRGWGVSFFFSSGGKSIVGEGFGLNFTKFGEDEKETVSVGDGYSYSVLGEGIRIGVPSPWLEELRRIASSPESFRSTAVKRYSELLAKVEAALKEGRIKRPVYGEYGGGGVPPPIIRYDALTKSEREELIAKGRKEIGAKIDIINSNYEGFYRSFMNVIDPAIF